LLNINKDQVKKSINDISIFRKYFVINIGDHSIDVNAEVNAYIFTGLRSSSR